MVIRDRAYVEPRIAAARIREQRFKGTINKELFIFVLDADGNQIKKRHWRNNNVDLIRAFVNKEILNPAVDKIIVSTEYRDWEVDVFMREG